MSRDTVVRAAGGIVHRTGSNGLEVLVVHRPKYDDWSFAKGKLDHGETEEAAARREVEEETGLRCDLGVELGTTAYTDGNRRPKTVRYWAMAATGGEFTPNREVDEVTWLPPAEASALLTYAHDRDLLARALPVLEASLR